mmetsp:Transcript_2097/g.2929  ORF Transcript_2097/g.2929 Transcript_2097/m.2929 type:complete len:220 (-) Transcript_2097:1652-2311(-)
MVFDAETKMASVRVKRGNLSGKIRNKEEFGKGGAGYLMVSIVLLALSGATMLMPWIAPIVWIVAGIFVWISDIKGIARDHLSWQPFKEADSKTEVKVPLLALLLSVLAAGVIGSIGWLRPLYNMIVLENFSLATLQEKNFQFLMEQPRGALYKHGICFRNPRGLRRITPTRERRDAQQEEAQLAQLRLLHSQRQHVYLFNHNAHSTYRRGHSRKPVFVR